MLNSTNHKALGILVATSGSNSPTCQGPSGIPSAAERSRPFWQSEIRFGCWSFEIGLICVHKFNIKQTDKCDISCVSYLLCVISPVCHMTIWKPAVPLEPAAPGPLAPLDQRDPCRWLNTKNQPIFEVTIFQYVSICFLCIHCRFTMGSIAWLSGIVDLPWLIVFFISCCYVLLVNLQPSSTVQAILFFILFFLRFLKFFTFFVLLAKCKPRMMNDAINMAHTISPLAGLFWALTRTIYTMWRN